MRTVKKLLLGETWFLPLGVACVLAGAGVLRRVAPHAWHDAGGALLAAGVVAVLCLSVARSARRRA
jgi:hypothetical protein